MRSGSEIHSSLEMVESELQALFATDPVRDFGSATQEEIDAAVVESERKLDAIGDLLIVRDVLRWAAGGHWSDVTNGPNPWLVAYLLDDPPKLVNTPPEVN